MNKVFKKIKLFYRVFEIKEDSHIQPVLNVLLTVTIIYIITILRIYFLYNKSN